MGTRYILVLLHMVYRLSSLTRYGRYLWYTSMVGSRVLQLLHSTRYYMYILYCSPCLETSYNILLHIATTEGTLDTYILTPTHYYLVLASLPLHTIYIMSPHQALHIHQSYQLSTTGGALISYQYTLPIYLCNTTTYSYLYYLVHPYPILAIPTIYLLLYLLLHMVSILVTRQVMGLVWYLLARHLSVDQCIYYGIQVSIILLPTIYHTLHYICIHVMSGDHLIAHGILVLLQAYRLQEYISSPPPLGTSTIHYYVVLQSGDIIIQYIYLPSTYLLYYLQIPSTT